MKDYNLEENYTPGLLGFKEKSDILTNLIQENLPELFKLIMGLCGSILPFDHLVSNR